jgi:hypothetical protein
VKYYVIPYSNDVMVYAIKALYNPYRIVQHAYCAGQPSPFGGAPVGYEDANAALDRETWEESAHTTRLFFAGQQFHDGAYLSDSGRWIECRFFRSTSFSRSGFHWPSWEARAKMGPASLEMSWVATARKEDFANARTSWDIAAVLLANARMQAATRPDVLDQIAVFPSEQYMTSLYSDAFAIFVRNWI